MKGAVDQGQEARSSWEYRPVTHALTPTSSKEKAVSSHDHYRGLTAAIATQHGKLPLIAPQLTDLGIAVVVADSVDTDSFGTFTGDRERLGSAHHAAEAKARAAIAALHTRLGLASEGTFGPHPAAPFIPLDVELVAFLDTEADLLVFGRAHSTQATWQTRSASPTDDLTAFLALVRFPHQGLVVHPTGRPGDAVKGITDTDTLHDAITTAYRAGNNIPVVVATDLRAHHNPARRPVIREAATDLAARLSTRCQACNSPGFGRERTQSGKPCSACGTPTSETSAIIHACPSCGYEQHEYLSGAADPRWCPTCNP